MARIPGADYTASVGGSGVTGVRASAPSPSSAIQKTGDVLIGIANKLSEAKDNDDLLNAQLQYTKAKSSLFSSYSERTDFAQAKEDYEKELGNIVENLKTGVSKRVAGVIDQQFKPVAQRDSIQFMAEMEKREGAFRLARFEENKDVLLNAYIFATTDEQKEQGLAAIETGVEAIRPFMNDDGFVKYKDGLLDSAKYNREARLIPEYIAQGIEFDAKNYSSLNPEQVLALEKAWKAEKQKKAALATSYYKDRINDHNTILLNMGKDDGLANELASMGAHSLADKVRSQDKLNKVVYDTVLGVEAKESFRSIDEKYEAALSKLSYDVGDEQAYEKQQVIDTLKAAHAREKKAFEKDPAMYAASALGMEEEDVAMLSQAEYRDALIQRQKELAGDLYFPAKILTEGERDVLQKAYAEAIASQNMEALSSIVGEIQSFGRYKYALLDELEAPPEVGIALDSSPRIAEKILSLASLKIKEIQPDFDVKYEVDNVTSSDYVKMLDYQIAKDPANVSLITHRNKIVEMGLKWIASGQEIDDLFSAYEVVDDDSGRYVLPKGMDKRVFNKKADTYLRTSVNYEDTILDSNPNKESLIKYYKEEATLVNAPPSDFRMREGEIGFYIQNPVTGKALIDYNTGHPVLLKDSDILSGDYEVSYGSEKWGR